MMDTISRLFSPGKRRSAAAQQRLAEAYQLVFVGAGGPQDAEIVLADLARHSRYFHTAVPGEHGTEELWDINGSRRLFARIMMFVNLPPEARDRLASVVMLEDAASQEEGNEL